MQLNYASKGQNIGFLYFSKLIPTSKFPSLPNSRNFQNYLHISPAYPLYPLSLFLHSPFRFTVLERYSQFLLVSSNAPILGKSLVSSAFFERTINTLSNLRKSQRRGTWWRAGQSVGRDKSHDGAKGARWPLDSSFPGHLARYTTVTSHMHSEKRRLTRVLLVHCIKPVHRLLRGRSLPRQIYES